MVRMTTGRETFFARGDEPSPTSAKGATTTPTRATAARDGPPPEPTLRWKARRMGHPPRRIRGGYWAGAALDSGLVNLLLSTGAVSTLRTMVVTRASGGLVTRMMKGNLTPLPMSR